MILRISIAATNITLNKATYTCDQIIYFLFYHLLSQIMYASIFQLFTF